MKVYSDWAIPERRRSIHGPRPVRPDPGQCRTSRAGPGRATADRWAIGQVVALSRNRVAQPRATAGPVELAHMEGDDPVDQETLLRILMRRAESRDPAVQETAVLALFALGLLQRDLQETQATLRTRNRMCNQLDKDRTVLTGQLTEVRAHLSIERARRRRLENQPPSAEPTDDSAEVRRLRAEIADLTADRDLYAELLDQAEDERDQALAARATALRRLLTAIPDDQELDADLAPGDRSDPEVDSASFAALIAAARHRYPQLAFTCDPEPMTLLDQYPQAPAWRRRTTAALHTLAQYAAEKVDARASGQTLPTHLADVLVYTRAGGAGVAIAAATVALGESEQVLLNDRFRSARVFTVPTEVDPTGTAMMAAHVRIGGPRAPEPRLHFLDDTDRTGQVIVGYIGPHLPTTRTN
jgi:hypothetical protein